MTGASTRTATPSAAVVHLPERRAWWFARGATMAHLAVWGPRGDGRAWGWMFSCEDATGGDCRPATARDARCPVCAAIDGGPEPGAAA